MQPNHRHAVRLSTTVRMKPAAEVKCAAPTWDDSVSCPLGYMDHECNSYWLSSEDRDFPHDKSLGLTAYRQACGLTCIIFDDSGDRLGWGAFNTEVQALNSIHLISLSYEYPLPDVSISNKERNIVILAKPSTTTTGVFECIGYLRFGLF